MSQPTENPFLHQAPDGEQLPTERGREFLEKTVTNTEDSVYSFTPELSPSIVAAAMARLSRFGGDMRQLLLKEFAGNDGQEEALLRRVLTQFGDDSVQQLDYVPVVVEGASNLLTKQLEWGRLAAYLEQSTRYIYYDQQSEGSYRYHTPEHLPAPLQAAYREDMDAIFSNYSQLVRTMTEWYSAHDQTPEAERDVSWRIAIRGKACDAARGLLPAATTSTVGVVGSAQAIDNMIMNLQASDLPEAQATGAKILREVRKHHGIFFERTDLEGRGAAITQYRRDTRRRMATLGHSLHAEAPQPEEVSAKLLSYTPKEELELLADMLYPHANLGYAALQRELAAWPREKQQAAFELYMGERGNRRHRPGRALEVAHYTLEMVCDYGAFRDLQRHRMVDALEWQQLSPHWAMTPPRRWRRLGSPGCIGRHTSALRGSTRRCKTPAFRPRPNMPRCSPIECAGSSPSTPAPLSI